MSKYIIYLIEDKEENANGMLKILNDIAPKYTEDEIVFEFKILKGAVSQEYGGEQYTFYDQSVLQQIEARVKSEIDAGNRVGLLLDVLLTKDDIEKTKKSYYAHASIAREIYFRFKDDVPIYFVTSTTTFASYSDIIIGENLSKQFISQVRLASDSIDSLKADLNRLFTFYREFKTIDKGMETDE